MRSHLIGETRFLFGEKLILEKRVFENNPSLGPGIRLPIGKVPVRGSTPLSPKEVSTN